MLAVYLFLPIVVIGALAVAGVIRSTAAEATRLAESLNGVNGLRPALVEVRTEAERARLAFEQLRKK